MGRFFGGLVVVASFFLGCSGSTSSGSSPGHPKNAAEVPAAFAQAVCGAATRCCGEQQFEFDTNACVADLSSSLSREIHRYDGQRVTFDPDAAARCIDDYANAVCPERPVDYDVKGNCSLMFVGKQEVGQPCSDDDECHEVNDNSPYCEDGVCHARSGTTWAGRGETCSGTCRHSVSDASVCDAAAFFPSDFPVSDISAPLCDTAKGLGCVSGDGPSTCQPLAKVGESCAGNSQTCVIGAYCNLDSGLCEAQRSSGPCDLQTPVCSADSQCDSDRLECVPRSAAVGDSCRTDADCDVGVCSSTGHCRSRLSADVCSMPLDL